ASARVVMMAATKPRRRRSCALALAVLALRTRRTELAPVSMWAAGSAVSEASFSQGTSSPAGSGGAAMGPCADSGNCNTGASGEVLRGLAPGEGIGRLDGGFDVVGGEVGQVFCGGGECPPPVTMVGSEGETPVAAKLKRGISASGG